MTIKLKDFRMYLDYYWVFNKGYSEMERQHKLWLNHFYPPIEDSLVMYSKTPYFRLACGLFQGKLLYIAEINICLKFGLFVDLYNNNF